ncbi:hypothetical protein WCLP8_960001 [uncultured Gammaproteobacteria bacterium]
MLQLIKCCTIRFLCVSFRLLGVSIVKIKAESVQPFIKCAEAGYRRLWQGTGDALEGVEGVASGGRQGGRGGFAASASGGVEVAARPRGVLAQRPRGRWENLLAAYVKAGFRAVNLNASGAVQAALETLTERGLVYTGVLEPPKGKTLDDWDFSGAAPGPLCPPSHSSVFYIGLVFGDQGFALDPLYLQWNVKPS